MTRYLHTLLFILITAAGQRAYCQTPYQTLDSLSKIISDSQLAMQGRTYTDENGHDHQLTFRVDNFKVFSHNRLAVKALVKKSNGTELLEFSHDIDLARATGITFATHATEGLYLKLHFPPDYLKTDVYKNGVFQHSKVEDYLEFFYDGNKLGANINCMYALARLVNLMKIEQRMMTKEKSETELEDFDKLTSEKFLAKHLSSIFAAHEREWVKKNEVARAKKLQNANTFMDSLATLYHVNKDISIAEFSQRYPDEAGKLLTRKNRIKQSNGGVVYQNMEYTALRELYFNAEDKLKKGVYCLEFPTIASESTEYNRLLKWIKNNIPSEYYRWYDDMIEVTGLDGKSYMVIYDGSASSRANSKITFSFHMP